MTIYFYKTTELNEGIYLNIRLRSSATPIKEIDDK